jgi:hypothetical protein
MMFSVIPLFKDQCTISLDSTEDSSIDTDKCSNSEISPMLSPKGPSYWLITEVLNISKDNHPLLGADFSADSSESENSELLLKKKDPKFVNGELDKNLENDCLQKFINSCMKCLRCDSTQGVIYSRIDVDGSTRRPYKNCNSCNYCCWLEDPRQDFACAAFPGCPTPWCNIHQIRETLFLEKEISNSLSLPSLTPIIHFLRTKFQHLLSPPPTPIPSPSPFPFPFPTPTSDPIFPSHPLSQTPISSELARLKFTVDNASIALEILTRFYQSLKYINSGENGLGEPLGLDQFYRYIIFKAIFGDVKKVEDNLMRYGSTLEYVFGSSLEGQAGLLFCIEDLLMNNLELDCRKLLGTILWRFRQSGVLGDEFLEMWRRGAEEIYGNREIVEGNLGVRDAEVDLRFRLLVEGEGFFGALDSSGDEESSDYESESESSDSDSEVGHHE